MMESLGCHGKGVSIGAPSPGTTVAVAVYIFSQITIGKRYIGCNQGDSIPQKVTLGLVCEVITVLTFVPPDDPTLGAGAFARQISAGQNNEDVSDARLCQSNRRYVVWQNHQASISLARMKDCQPFVVVFSENAS
jgi:hypothetical protein